MTTTANRDAAVAFFYQHGSYSHNPATETEEEGRRRCAEDLAAAERWAQDHDINFGWSEDWGVGSHFEEFGEAYDDGEPETCEQCVALSPEREVLASLGCIDDATPEYRRVIEAELASEARSQYELDHVPRKESDMAPRTPPRTVLRHIFCSVRCRDEYFSCVLAYPGDGHETECQNCGLPLDVACPTCQGV